MKHFLLPRTYAGEPRLTLTGGDFRYLVRVLRLAPGDGRTAIDAGGRRYSLRIAAVEDGGVVVDLAPQASEPGGAGGSVEITLLQCLPKGRKMDSIVRQATEAGVSRIVPVVSEHSLVRPDDHHRERYLRIAREAVQQSGAPRLPVIDEPCGFAQVPGNDWGVALFFHERRMETTSLHGLLADRPRRVSIVIGPEGGLSAAEVALLQGAGFSPVWLGDGVLRVETAAVFALGAVRMTLQERDWWIPVQSS
jgi:16S rRNA (uracil1498-N3)-methyltransferase